MQAKMISLNSPQKRNNNAILFSIILIALFLRIYFAIHGSKYYFGSVVYAWKDTSTYFDAFFNWHHYGSYQFDLQEPDSRFFRTPIYPFFLGFFYLLFGKSYEIYVAFSQVFIDTLNCYLIYLIAEKTTKNQKISFLSALCYATWPFVILWVPILYTEIIISTATIVIILKTLSNGTQSKKHYSLLGLIGGIAFLTKQYAALLIIFPISHVIFSNENIKNKTRNIIYISLGFIITISPWVIRNYLVSDEIIVLRGKSTGIVYVGRDFEAFERFANIFDQNVTPHLSSVAHEAKLQLHIHTTFLEKNKLIINDAVETAFRCGPSFTSLRGMERTETYKIDCTDLVAIKFKKLTSLAWKEIPLKDIIKTRIQASAKVFIGNTLNEKNPVLKLLYSIRFIIVTAAFILLFLPSRLTGVSIRERIPFLFTFIGFSTLFSWFYVHVEIRYMLLPEIILITSIPLTLSGLFNKSLNNSQEKIK